MRDPPRVAVILVNCKDYAQRHLAECYQSLCSQDYPKQQMSVFIVDNESSTESRAHIRAIAPSIRLLENKENLGWAGGNNTALRAALTEGFEYFILLNMDTVLEPTWLLRLAESAQETPGTHILQSKILIYGTSKINSIGNRIQYLGYGYCNGYGHAETEPLRFPMDFASGASMLVKKQVFEVIGLFRDDYFMYCEDLEFCWRARLAGFHIGLAERSVCHHKYSVSNVLNAVYYIERNRLLTLLTLEKWGTLLLILPCLIPVGIGSTLYFALQGRGRAMRDLIGYFLRWKTWRSVWRERRKIQRLRTRKDADIVGGFAGFIVFAEIKNPFFNNVINPLLGFYWMVARRLIFW